MDASIGHRLATPRLRRPRTFLHRSGLFPLAARSWHLLCLMRSLPINRFTSRIDGHEVRFVTTDPQSRRFFQERYRQGDLHEPPVSVQLAARARQAAVFADVGAHLGYYACLARVVNPALHLCLFEMNHRLMPIIARNLAANGVTDADVVNRPVADCCRRVSYSAASAVAGLAMSPRLDGAERIEAGGADRIEVDAITLDAFFAGRGVVPDFIKIDVEGAEAQVLAGAADLLRERRPTLFVEVHPKSIGCFGGSVEEVYGRLAGHGYRVQLIDEHRRRSGGLRPISNANDLPTGTHVLLCS